MNAAPKKTIAKHRVKIYTTDGWEIQGHVSIPVGGYNSRLSDFLNNSTNNFIALTDALVYSEDGKLLATESFISVNKQAVKLVIDEDAEGEIGESGMPGVE